VTEEKTEKKNYNEDIKAMLKRFTEVERLKGKPEYKQYESKLVVDLEKFTAMIEKEATPAQFRAYRELLRTRDRLSRKHYYLLNEHDAKNAKESCFFRPTEAVHGDLSFCEIEEKYKFTRVYDEGRKKFVYTVFTTRVVEGEEQIDKKLAQKIARGFVPDEKDFKKDYTQWHRVTLVENMFSKYFVPENDLDEIDDLAV